MRLLLLCLVSASLSGQVAKQANEGYRDESGRSRVAALLSDPHRDGKQKPQELVAAMELKPGMAVADVGTGVGYMLPFLAQAVGPAGKVIAQDIFSDFLQQARKKAEAEKLSNVEFLLGAEDDPKLPTGQLDAILVLDAYHHFDYPEEMLAHFRTALKPQGRLFVVDYHKNQEAMPEGRALQHIRLAADDAIREISANRFTLVNRHDHVARVQWMGEFSK